MRTLAVWVLSIGAGFAQFKSTVPLVVAPSTVTDAQTGSDVTVTGIGDDIGGLAVNIGARVGAKAQAGEVLVSQTVRDLVAGSGFAFVDRGEHELKGVPGTWRVHRASV